MLKPECKTYRLQVDSWVWTTAGQTAAPGIATSTTRENVSGAGAAASRIEAGLTAGTSGKEGGFIAMSTAPGPDRDLLEDRRRLCRGGAPDRQVIARHDETTAQSAHAAEITTVGAAAATWTRAAHLVDVGETEASMTVGVGETTTLDGNGSRRGRSPKAVDDRESPAGGEQEELDEEEQMKRLMGFAGFDSTQGKKVVGSDASGAAINKQRTYRQYMNRRRGFNRNLSPTS
ncbi:hypothetical protein HDU86_000706 [Geranomyces michiganensis]|nr:hypothetical protein HDU86_000706 [Geranomyces michiganensis]